VVVVVLVGASILLQAEFQVDQVVVQVLERQLPEQEHQDKVMLVVDQTLDHMPLRVAAALVVLELLEIHQLISQDLAAQESHGHILV
jgi:hypothetical protein